VPCFATEPVSLWSVQSIDTVKYSRDLSREKVNDPSFDGVIEQQVAAIAKTGATHISIGTPYDEEFWLMTERWVEAARRHNLNVWFRGNWSGWEEWFGYDAIDRVAHIQKTDELIRNHKQWFSDGDIFTACPECENGGPGDPRRTGDVAGHRQFLIEEYLVTQQAFDDIDRKVRSNFNSMNDDVARLIMDRKTTTALGGVVTVDHYVVTPKQLVKDLISLGEQSGGQVVLGEFGVPIVDIHGKMSSQEQSDWIEQALQDLAQVPNLLGVNYWSSVGGTTQLWDSDGEARQAVDILESYYKPTTVSGVVLDELGLTVVNVVVRSASHHTITNRRGEWRLPMIGPAAEQINFSAVGYGDKQITANEPKSDVEVTLVKLKQSWLYRVLKSSRLFINRLLG